MFTGIIEAIGIVKDIRPAGTNKSFEIESVISSEIGVDNSVAHNGVCLTVTETRQDSHWVTAVEETLRLTNLGFLTIGSLVNLERSMMMGSRLEGHIVQGHVDTTAQCIKVEPRNGSFEFSFRLNQPSQLLVPKGSICINGVSLTVINPVDNTFSVAIIPFTFEHTTFKSMKPNDWVNIEFDILGKYIQRLLPSN